MLTGLPCTWLRHHCIIAWAWLYIFFQYVDARPRVLISGPEALPDDDLLPLESGPEPVLNLNVGTAPYTSDILHDGVTSQAFEDTGTAPQILSRSSKGWDSASGHAELDLVSTKTRTSSTNFMRTRESDIQRVPAADGATPGPNVVSSGFAKAQEIVRKIPLPCHDARDDVVVESGLRNKPDVVVRGVATSSWSPSAKDALTQLGAAVSVMAFVVHLGKGTVLEAPRLVVTDPSTLVVQFIEKDDDSDDSGYNPLATIFIARHICKRKGTARVTVELPLAVGKSHKSLAGDHSCPGPLKPVVFSYMKACDSASSMPAGNLLGSSQQAEVTQDQAKALWRQVVAADDDNFVDLVRKTDSKSSDSIIPEGGVRTFLLVALICTVVILIFEFGTYYVNQKVKRALADMGPEVFGVKTTLQDLRITFTAGHFAYRLKNFKFYNPDGDYQGPYLINIEEVKIWVNVTKMFCTCFNEIEVVSLTIDGLACEVEVDGYVLGQPNVMCVLKKMEENNKQFKQDMDKLKKDIGHTGIDPHEVMKSIEGHIQSILSRVKLKEVFIGGITYHLSTKLGGIKTSLADMEFHDFTEHHGEEGRDAIGAKNIAYYLGHEIFAALAKDIAGVEIGHDRFHDMLTSIKSWVK